MLDTQLLDSILLPLAQGQLLDFAPCGIRCRYGTIEQKFSYLQILN